MRINLIMKITVGTLYCLMAEVALSQMRMVHVSAPVVTLGRDTAAHIEMNVSNVGSLALEGTYVSEGEEYSPTEVEEEKRSLLSKGYGVSLHFARFTQPASMGGFYWSLGAGYRKMEATWVRPADEQYSLKGDEELDDDGRLVTRLDASGVTGHARGGYRYVADSYPFLVGIYLGFKHFESKYQDADENPGTPTTDKERLHLKYLTMTRPEAAVEIGLSF